MFNFNHEGNSKSKLKALIFFLISVVTTIIGIVFFDIFTLAIIMFVIDGTSLILFLQHLAGAISYRTHKEKKYNNDVSTDLILENIKKAKLNYENKCVALNVDDIKINKEDNTFKILLNIDSKCKIKLDTDDDISNYKDSLKIGEKAILKDIKSNLLSLNIKYEIKTNL